MLILRTFNYLYIMLYTYQISNIDYNINKATNEYHQDIH
jgi:hypothetical protein